jgi:signal transduction histidine kinase
MESEGSKYGGSPAHSYACARIEGVGTADPADFTILSQVSRPAAPVLEEADDPKLAMIPQWRRSEKQPSEFAAWLGFRVAWLGGFGRAEMAAGDRPAALEIRASDRGPGIPTDEQEHIFEPFFRGWRAVRDQIHGTGLGLSLVKKIVEAHGGNIRVKSEPMKGAEFIVWLPAAPAGAAG